jgi:hypothetical protein
VLRGQFLAVGVGLRRELTVAAALILGVTVIALITIAIEPDGGTLMLSPDGAGFALGWIGLFAPLAVWKGEGPTSRGYLWSLPVPRPRHTLVKVFAGWAWLMITIALFLAFIALQTWISGGSPGIDELRFVPVEGVTLSDGTRAAVDPSLLREVRWMTPAWQWAVPFLAPSIMYLIGTVAALLSDHPWRWFAGVAIGFGLVAVITEATSLHQVAELAEAFMTGTYGLETLLTGSNEATIRVETTAGADVHVWRNLAEARQWFTTALIWFVPACTGVIAAAHHYQER